ncbi:FG-GAP-like repeat-containing protein [Streptomyces sp. NPDC057638]|uniref:FG-GAP-like repeat-containing protein n=1 Tax=Streptomyces sp. NPDC057638 TaxID=3346190 RepID=UPI0036B1C478
MKLHKRTLVTAIAVASASLLAGLAPAAVAAPASATAVKANAASDFNGDGYGDLVVSQSAGTVDGKAEAGAVVVLYGSKTGVSSARKQVITQNSPGVPGTAEAYDRFGAQTVTGDFDHDGFTDLAVSASGEDITLGTTYRRNAGQLAIVWGGKNGLTRHGGVTAAQTEPTAADWRRGSSLAAGDFNGDGRPDLAAGDHSAGRGGEVLYGPISRTGKPKSTVNLGVKNASTKVSTALDAGDVTGDGIGDLLIQVFHGWNEHVPGPSIEIYRGTKKGMVRSGHVTNAQGWRLGASGTADGHVAVGDVNKDGYADIAVGGGESRSYPHKRNEITLVFGGPQGQSTTREPQVITQETFAVPDDTEDGDDFGHALSIADTNGDGHGDLAIGARGEGKMNLPYGGQVTVLLGGKRGVVGDGARVYQQGTPGIPAKPVPHDHFGSAVHLTDVDGDRRADVAIGSSGCETSPSRVSVVITPKPGTTVVRGVAYTTGQLGLTAGLSAGFGTGFGR